MGSYREYILSESARNCDLMFLYRKLDWGNPYLSLAYWIANDRFAERIRGMMQANEEITNESVLYVMREIFCEYRAEVGTGHEPDFNFAMAKKVMRKLEDASTVEPWASREWDRQAWRSKIVFPDGFEDQSYLEDFLYNLGMRTSLVRAFCKDIEILQALREFGIVTSVNELKTVINTVFEGMVSQKLYSKRSTQLRRFFNVREILTELSKMNDGNDV